MASKAVCCDGDVVATAGTKPVEGSTGSWTAGQVSYKTYSHLKSSGTAVAYEASCTFSYSGNTTSTPSSPVTSSETVTLTASSSVLQDGSSKVLRDGDSKKGDGGYLNELKVQSSRILKSA
jgi:hypothetical protein